MTPAQVRLGLRENLAQFALLVALNAFVGAMIGLERSALPLVGEQEFGLRSSAAVLSFIVAFGLAKALTNLAPSWSWIVAANVLLGVNQGLAWSMTVVMKIDLVGPRRRGLALGLNEAAGYGGLAVAAAMSGWLAAEFAPRDVVASGGAAIALIALVVSVLFVRDTEGHVALEQAMHRGGGSAPPSWRQGFAAASYREPTLRACSQAGLANNLNDALAWGLVPLFLAARGASIAQIGLVAGLYPAVWGVGQIATGHWSDRVGRRPLIVAGMFVQAAALGLLALADGAVTATAGCAVALGAGTALVYPTLIAAISDAVPPVARASAVGVYRFWRDMGYVAGAVIAGVAADALGFAGAIVVVAALTAASGAWVALDWSPAPLPGPGAGEEGRVRPRERRGRPAPRR